MSFKFINERTKKEFIFKTNINRADPETNEKLKLVEEIATKKDSAPKKDVKDGKGSKAKKSRVSGNS